MLNWRTNGILSFYTNLLLYEGPIELQPVIQTPRKLEVSPDRSLYARTDYSYNRLIRIISLCAGPTGDTDYGEGGHVSSVSAS